MASSTTNDNDNSSNSDSNDDDDDDDDFMIQCEAPNPNCQKWYSATHDINPPITPTQASQYEKWHCESCIPYHGPSIYRTLRDGLRKRKRRINFLQLNDPSLYMDSISTETASGGQTAVTTSDGQDIDFGSMVRQRRHRGLFKNGIINNGEQDEEEGGGGCLMKLNKGEVFNLLHVTKHGFDKPILFRDETPEELGLRVPTLEDVKGIDNKNYSNKKSENDNDDDDNNVTNTSTKFSYEHVAQLVGPYRPVQVIDTSTQLTTVYTLQEWVEYLYTKKEERTRILNVITLEFSSTPLGNMVIEPQFARDVDFVYNHWPTLHPRSRLQSQFAFTNTELTSNGTINNGIGGGSDGDEGLGSSASSSSTPAGEDVVDEDEIAELYEELKKEQPRVTKYCLMSAAGSWTDFHVDFGGTSVWYHIYSGSKIFYFIEPTPQNLKIYSKWATTSNGRYEFLPDLITAAGGDVYEVQLHEGQTLFIASGWIHAVYTPDDSLVFGGNFVHKHSLEMQLTIYRLERQMKVGKEYKFPNYQKLMWYAARDFLNECTNPPESQHNVEEGNATVLGANETVKKQEQHQHDQVQAICSTYPTRILKGYMALAKELERWSTSKEKRTIEQYPENMNIAEVARELGNMIKLCMAYIHNNEKRETKQSAKPSKPKAISATTKQFLSEEQPTKVASEEDRPDLGPGWTVSIIPRKTGRKCDYFYNSPTGLRFKSLTQAKATAKKLKVRAKSTKSKASGATSLTIATTKKLVSAEQVSARVASEEDRPDLGPGWTVSIIPRKTGRKCDYFYNSPVGERFKSLKQARARSKAKANRVITTTSGVTKLVPTEEQRVATCANRPDLGPGWKVSIVPRKIGRKCDYYYHSPTGLKFKSLKQAKALAEESALVGSLC